MAAVTHRLGLVVNPVAGIGGPAGLKGSDGSAVQAAARDRGATARAQDRAGAALAVLAAARPGLTVLTAAGPMGADAVAAAGLHPRVVHRPADDVTTARDTVAAADALVHAGADLVLFVGGDGTARDVASGVDGRATVLGVPAGVKMYSGCFAVGPRAAGALAAGWLDGATATEQREVLDVDEDQVRTGRVDPRLHALVAVPVAGGRTQARKSATPASEGAAVRAAAAGAVAAMAPGTAYLLGPGGTTARVADLLGVAGTPLGVDVVRDGRLVLADASERDLLDVVAGGPARAVVTVIGGQGFLLGRGNQQLSARVLAALGDDPLLVVATETKLHGLRGRPLLVDTGDPAVDRRLAGYVRVLTGVGQSSVYPVRAPEDQDDERTVTCG